MKVTHLLDLPDLRELQEAPYGYIPNTKFPSDHIRIQA